MILFRLYCGDWHRIDAVEIWHYYGGATQARLSTDPEKKFSDLALTRRRGAAGDGIARWRAAESLEADADRPYRRSGFSDGRIACGWKPVNQE
jgi:hypothetical protein